MPANPDSVITVGLILQIIPAAMSIVGAIVSWTKVKKVSEKIKADEYNRLIGKMESDLAELLNFAISYWSDSNLNSGSRNVLSHKITSKNKDISRDITRARNSFPDLMGNTDELRDELNALYAEITGGNFQSNPTIDNNRVKMIVEKTGSINKTLSLRVKTW